MKKIIIILGFVFFVFFGVVSETKEENIRTLIVMTGSGDLGIQVIDAMLPQFKKMLTDVPEDYWVKFREKLDVNELIDLIIPIS